MPERVVLSGSFVPPEYRYRLYFDETGTGDLHAARKDENQRYLSVTGIVMLQAVHDDEITPQLNTLKQDVFGHTNINLHRRDIIDKSGPFHLLNDGDVRRKFDNGFVAFVHKLPAPIFTVSIDKLAHLEKYKVWQFNPYHYVITCLLERFVLWLHYSGNRGDVMGEARNPTHDAQLRRSFRYFYTNGTKVGPGVIRQRLISKELRLEPKTANVAGLQIADLLAHPAHRNYKFLRLGIPIPDDYGTSLVTILEDSKYNRRPSDGKIEGYGRKWLP